jgi:hypothetical protein
MVQTPQPVSIPAVIRVEIPAKSLIGRLTRHGPNDVSSSGFSIRDTWVFDKLAGFLTLTRRTRDLS